MNIRRFVCEGQGGSSETIESFSWKACSSGTQPAQWIRQDARTQSGTATKSTPPEIAKRLQALRTADANGDGKLSREEFQSAGAGLVFQPDSSQHELQGG